MSDTINKFKSILDKVKNLGSVVVANAVAAATSGLFWLYIATVIGPDDYGLISYLVAAATIGITIASLGTYNTIVVYGVKKESVHSSMYTLSIISSVTVALILYMILNKVEVSLFVILFALFGLAQADLRSRKNYRHFSVQMISQRILLVVLAVGLFYMFGVSGIILGMALSYVPFAYRLRVGFSESKFDISKIKAKLGFMMNNYINGLLDGFDRQIDKIVIAAVLGFTTLGNYNLAMQFVILTTIISLSAGQYLLSEESSGMRHKKLKKIIMLISVCLTLVAIFLARHVFVQFFPDFTGLQNIMPILSLAIVPITINFILTSEFLGNEKSKIVLVGGLILVSVHVTGIVILGKLYEESGIAIAYVLGTICQSMFFLTMKRRMRLNV